MSEDKGGWQAFREALPGMSKTQIRDRLSDVETRLERIASTVDYEGPFRKDEFANVLAVTREQVMLEKELLKRKTFLDYADEYGFWQVLKAWVTGRTCNRSRCRAPPHPEATWHNERCRDHVERCHHTLEDGGLCQNLAYGPARACGEHVMESEVGRYFYDPSWSPGGGES